MRQGYDDETGCPLLNVWNLFTCNWIVQLMRAFASGTQGRQALSHTSCAAESIPLAGTTQGCFARMTLKAHPLRMHAARHAGAHRRVSMCSFTCCCQVLESLGCRGPCRGVPKCSGNHVVHNLCVRELPPSHHGLQAGRPCSLRMRLLVFLSAHHRLLIQGVTLSLACTLLNAAELQICVKLGFIVQDTRCGNEDACACTTLLF